MGKTRFGVSAFWDFTTSQPIRKGVWVKIGAEDNIALDIPDKFVKRFASDSESPLRFISELKVFLKRVILDGRKGKGLEVIVLDGFTEWLVNFETGYGKVYGGDDKWGLWRELKSEFIQLMQLIKPADTGAWLIATARLKRASESDPEWMEEKFVPSMDGWAKDNIGYYFDAVLYMSIQERNEKGKLIPDYSLYMLPRKGYWIKDVWGERWMELGLPNPVKNPSFEQVKGMLEGEKEDGKSG